VRTDANLVLGLVNPDGLLPMDVAKAEQSVQPIARHFGLPVAETAAGTIAWSTPTWPLRSGK
jgi:hypothetical protein